MDQETKTSMFHVEINRGPTQIIETRTGLYELAAMAALATLNFKPSEGLDIVKIWVPDLLPDYGPYFYTWSHRGISQLVGDDGRKW